MHTVYQVRQPQAARQIRQAWLIVLGKTPPFPLPNQLYHFLREYITPADFDDIPWQNPTQAAQAVALLGPLTDPGQLSRDRRALLRQALRYFAQQDNFAAMQQLLQQVSPILIDPDAELICLREQLPFRRMQVVQNRRLWFGSLTGLLILCMLVIFPLLFMIFEQPANRGSEPVQPVTYVDGLYHSLVTPVGFAAQAYGPQSLPGQVLSEIAGMTKLLTIGTLSSFFHQQLLHQRLRGSARQQVLRCRRLVDESLVADWVGTVTQSAGGDDPPRPTEFG
jgi:hypothetical protein